MGNVSEEMYLEGALSTVRSYCRTLGETGGIVGGPENIPPRTPSMESVIGQGSQLLCCGLCKGHTSNGLSQ